MDLAKLLPHKPPMILIDDVVDYSLEEKWLKSVVTIKEDCLYYDSELQGVNSIIGIEYMAQTIGCYAFLKKQKEFNIDKPQIGFLLGTRLYNNLLKKFDLEKSYYILVKEVFIGEISSFECFIYNDKNIETADEIASATLNVYQDDNIEEKIYV